VRRILQNITAVQLAYSIVAQARPLADGKGAGFVADQPQRKIEFLPVSRIAIVGHSHGRPPLQFTRFWVKKNLTEINHKVRLSAKWFLRDFAAAFMAKCAGPFEPSSLRQ
jgi:hypothetical protein